MSKPRILFVAHQASRTGAPKALLHVMEALQDDDLTRIAVVKQRGPLTGDFRRLADRVWVEPLYLVKRNALRFRLKYIPGALRLVDHIIATWVIRKLAPDLVYANTVAAADYVRPAVAAGIPTILHCHEVGEWLASYLHAHRLPELRGRFTPVACSGAVQRELVQVMGIPAEQVPVVYEPVDARRVQELAAGRDAESATADGAAGALVAACGVLEPRKGPDLWLEMAARSSALMPESRARYLWIGGGEPELSEMAAQARSLGVEDQVWLPGESENPFPLLSRVDVFTLTSRFDPFPLAVLEAMALGKPIVAFAVDGLPEMLGDTGVLVPPGDIQAMAEAVIGLLKDPVRRESLGRKAAQRVAERFDITRFRTDVRQLVTRVLPRIGLAEADARVRAVGSSPARGSHTAG